MKNSKYFILISVIFLFLSNKSFANHQALTWDFGLAFGNYGGNNYTEYNLGINLFFYPWLSIRNSGYYRAADDDNAIYGLDSSLRGHLNLKLTEAATFLSHAGGGYRFSNRGKSTPFLETSIGIRATRMIISGGIKYLLHSVVTDNANNEMIYLVTISI